jgi:hypothetical protein
VPAPRPTRATAALVSAVLVATAGAAIVQVRAEAAAEEEAERRAAQVELDREVYLIRSELVTPAQAAERTTADLLIAVVETVTGSERDPEAIRATLDQLVADLHTAADHLDEAAAQPMPTRPQATPVPTADAVFARLQGLEDRASEVAEQVRAAAEDAEAFAVAAHELSSAAADYAASTEELPDSDDPDTLAAAWRAEGERLDRYGEAVEQAAATEGLEELASSHGELVDTLRGLATDAVSSLEAGDVDGYNAQLTEVLGDDDVRALADDLVRATEDALEAATFEQLQAARTAVLELLIDLEDLRRVTGVETS